MDTAPTPTPVSVPAFPSVTIDHIESQIVDTVFFTVGSVFKDEPMKEPYHPSLDLLTICVLVLKNGFTVTGESACADPRNFDREKGQQIARSKAVEKLWPLFGFLLKDQMHQQELISGVPVGGSVLAQGAEGDRQAEGRDAVGTGDAEAALIEDLEHAAQHAEQVEHFTLDETGDDTATRAEPFGEQEQG